MAIRNLPINQYFLLLSRIFKWTHPFEFPRPAIQFEIYCTIALLIIMVMIMISLINWNRPILEPVPLTCLNVIITVIFDFDGFPRVVVMSLLPTLICKSSNATVTQKTSYTPFSSVKIAGIYFFHHLIHPTIYLIIKKKVSIVSQHRERLEYARHYKTRYNLHTSNCILLYRTILNNFKQVKLK